MKKMVKAALAAVLVCFSSSLFAAEPESFLKGTTFGLFEDEVVDNLAWGVEDTTGLVLGGFNSSNFNFNIGTGAWLGDFWWSLYDTGTFSTNRVKTQSVTNDAYAKDGINTDYVNTTSETKKERDNTVEEYWDDTTNTWQPRTWDDLNNQLFLSFSTGDWGIQSYWKYRESTNDSEYGKKEEFNEDKTLGQSHTKTTKKSPYSGTNTFGANFNGISASEIGDVDLYFQLNNFEVEWYKRADNEKYTESFKQNGATYTDGTTGYNTRDYKEVDTWNRITPTVSGEMGLSLSDLGTMSTKFILGERFSSTLAFSKYETTTTTVVENFNTKTTTKSTNKSNQKMDFSWENTFAPKFVFDFDVGERLSVKASAGASITLSGDTENKPYTGTYISESTTYNKINKTTTKNYTKNVTQWSGNNQLVKNFNTEIIPNTALALVYQVKPEKFNLNMGVQWNVGTFTWKTVKSTNEASVKETRYSESTDAAGTKTVTQDEVTVVNRGDGPNTGDATPETKVTTYTAKYSNAPVLKLGATWFITENATLDIAYTNAGFTNLTLWNGLMNSNLKLMFSVKF